MIWLLTRAIISSTTESLSAANAFRPVRERTSNDSKLLFMKSDNIDAGTLFENSCAGLVKLYISGPYLSHSRTAIMISFLGSSEETV
jgi:hypothetical protein